MTVGEFLPDIHGFHAARLERPLPTAVA